jgi:hypothetical protein
MRERLPISCLLVSVLMAGPALAQTSSDSQLVPLCELQTKLAQGEHKNVRVEGVYHSGTDVRYLGSADCSGRSTLINFELRTRKLWNNLLRLSKGRMRG